MWVCVCTCMYSMGYFYFFPMLVCFVGGDVYTVAIAAPKEPSWLCMYHQSLTHPQLQKWNPADICKYMAPYHHRISLFYLQSFELIYLCIEAVSSCVFVCKQFKFKYRLLCVFMWLQGFVFVSVSVHLEWSWSFLCMCVFVRKLWRGTVLCSNGPLFHNPNSTKNIPLEWRPICPKNQHPLLRRPIA